ncbi:MAG: acyl--CoA ligase [Clostridia bacterium]|nr:acyl--CoA ligase [Clostridia bacterium]
MKSDATIYQIIKMNAEKNLDSIAYDFLGFTSTYGEFLKDIDRCADYLYASGIKEGDIITIYLPNVPRALMLFYAANKIGAVSNFIHPNMAVAESLDLLKRMRPKAVFLLDSMILKLRELQSHHISTQYFIIKVSEFLPLKYQIPYRIKEIFFRMKIKVSNEVSYYNDKNTAASGINEYMNAYGNATILFTGGTTGVPKGVCLSSKNINEAALLTGNYRKDRKSSDKMLAVLPVFHGYGLVNCIHTTFIESCRLIILPYFKDRLFIRTILTEKPNYILGIPKLYSKMAELLEKRNADVSFFKGLYCGGSKLSESIRKKINRVLIEKNSSALVQEGYGLTECVGACTIMPADRYKENSIGLPYEGVRIRIVKPDSNQVLPSNQTGEICINSETVMIGYFQEESNNIYVDNGERWLHTGDLGYADNEGFIFFVDRLKRMIKILGYEVYPELVEATISKLENVTNCCVVEKTEGDNTLLKAYVVLTNITQKAKAQKDILQICEKNLSKWSIPREIEFVSSIPETLLKKNDYRKLS